GQRVSETPAPGPGYPRRADDCFAISALLQLFSAIPETRPVRKAAQPVSSPRGDKEQFPGAAATGRRPQNRSASLADNAQPSGFFAALREGDTLLLQPYTRAV